MCFVYSAHGQIPPIPFSSYFGTLEKKLRGYLPFLQNETCLPPGKGKW